MTEPKRTKLYRPPRTETKRYIRPDKPEPKRNMDLQKLYNRKWDKYRFRFLHHNKRCYACGLKATVCDHIVPHKGEVEVFWDKRNFMPLCKQCHDFVTLHYDRHVPPLTESKGVWLEKKREVTNTTVRIKIVPFKGENK